MCKFSWTLLPRFGMLTHGDRIESMKMETVIRSPQNGVIKKLAHKEGVSRHFTPDARIWLTYSQDICKAGTVLVLFEEEDATSETS